MMSAEITISGGFEFEIKGYKLKKAHGFIVSFARSYEAQSTLKKGYFPVTSGKVLTFIINSKSLH